MACWRPEVCSHKRVEIESICNPHPAQSLQSVCPGMPPLTAIPPWNNRELFGKGWQNQHAVCRLSPRYSAPFGSTVCSKHQRAVGGCRMLGLIKRLGACVFRVRSHRLKEITYREKQWGTFPILVQLQFSSVFLGGGG